MKNDDLRAYKDYLGHFSELSDQNLKIYAEQAKQYLSSIEKEAKKYDVHPNYYILEFM